MRDEARIARDVVPVIFEVGVAREDAPDLVGDHVESFKLHEAELRYTIMIVHDDLEPLCDVSMLCIVAVCFLPLVEQGINVVCHIVTDEMGWFEVVTLYLEGKQVVMWWLYCVNAANLLGVFPRSSA